MPDDLKRKIELYKRKMITSKNNYKEIAKRHPNMEEYCDSVRRGIEIAEEYFLRYFDREGLIRKVQTEEAIMHCFHDDTFSDIKKERKSND